MQINTKSVRG